VVGDDAQAIYSFRGANLKEILNFEKRYFGTHKIVMDLNYRSTSNIVEASTRLINNNAVGFKKHLKAVSEEEGEPIYIARRYSTEDEADYITKLTMCMEGTIGILVRAYWLIPSIEEALKRKHTKYKILRDISRNLDEENDNEETKVFISTIHAAKGLEFDNVIVAGAEDGIIPHYLSLDGYGDIEEERRLFYVALTRAKKQIVITYCCNRKRWGIPSRFIEEIPDKYKEEL
jgi:DNA helicase-2/ATP-dependent DNA helicase PcrA